MIHVGAGEAVGGMADVTLGGGHQVRGRLARGGGAVMTGGTAAGNK